MRTDSPLRRAVLAGTAALAALALAAGCGGSSGQSGSSRSPSPAASQTVAITEDDVRSVLLTAADIGDDYEDRDPPGANAPLPCAAAGDATLDEQAPPAVQAGALLVSPSLQGQISQQVRVYDNTAAASAALEVVIAGFGCPTGTLYSSAGSSPISIVGPSDATAEVGVSEVDGVIAWQFTSAQIRGLVVVSQFGASLMLLTQASPLGSDPALYPDLVQVIKGALRKIVSS